MAIVLCGSIILYITLTRFVHLRIHRIKFLAPLSGTQFRQISHPIVAPSRLSFTVRLMRRYRSTETLLDPLAEPERYIHFLRRIRKTMAENRNQRPLKENAQPSDEEPSSSIVYPAINTNNF